MMAGGPCVEVVVPGNEEEGERWPGFAGEGRRRKTIARVAEEADGGG